MFTFGAMVVAIITGWLAQRYRKRTEDKQQRSEQRQAIEQHFNDKLDSISSKLDEHGEKINGIQDDVIYLRSRVAVHDDRWERAKLKLVSEHEG